MNGPLPQVGAPIFTNGTHFNETVCEHLDDDNYPFEYVQDFVQDV